MALHKKHKRLLAYVGILGGAAILSLTFFTISQYEKAKYQASVSVELMSKNKFDQVNDAYKDSNPGKEFTNPDKAVLEDESEGNKYYEAALYWDEVYTNFVKITDANSAAYQGTAIPAYILSMSTLVAFGLILKHAETAKEKEDEEEVMRQMS